MNCLLTCNRLLFLTLIALVLPCTLQAKTIYVDDVRNNGIGSESQPFNDLQFALDVVQPGDVIFLNPGNYTGSWTTARSGTADQRIYIDGASRTRTTLNGRSLADKTGLVVLHDFYSISRMTFRNHVGNGITVAGAFSNTGFIESIHISDCRFVRNGRGENGGHGILIENASDVFIGDVNCDYNGTNGATILNCAGGNIRRSKFNRNRGRNESEGLAFINSQFFTVSDCEARLNAESGFDSSIFEPIARSANDILFQNCAAMSNGAEGFSVNGTLTGNQISRAHRFVRCLAFSNNDGGFNIYENAREVTIINCTALRNKNRGVSNFDGGNGILIANSLFWGNKSPDGAADDAGGDPSVYTANYNYWSALAPGFGGIRGANDVPTGSRLGFAPNFQLRTNSDLIDRGSREFGVEFLGNAPDLGWSERE